MYSHRRHVDHYQYIYLVQIVSILIDSILKFQILLLGTVTERVLLNYFKFEPCRYLSIMYFKSPFVILMLNQLNNSSERSP